MTNHSKKKGDRAERQAVAYLLDAAPQLIDVATPMRQLGAGRKDDTGDLNVFTDTAVQVRALAPERIGQAIRSSAHDAVRQAVNRHVPHALGMVPVHGAAATSVRWLACSLHWPALPWCEPLDFVQVGKALDWLRCDTAPYGFLAHPRSHRVARLPTVEGGVVLVAPMEAWLDALGRARALHSACLHAA